MLISLTPTPLPGLSGSRQGWVSALGQVRALRNPGKYR